MRQRERAVALDFEKLIVYQKAVDFADVERCNPMVNTSKAAQMIYRRTTPKRAADSNPSPFFI